MARRYHNAGSSGSDYSTLDLNRASPSYGEGWASLVVDRGSGCMVDIVLNPGQVQDLAQQLQAIAGAMPAKLITGESYIE